MIKVLDFVFQSFWIWLGSMVMLYIITNFIVNILNSWFYHRTVRKIGYPPVSHIDTLTTIKEELPKSND